MSFEIHLATITTGSLSFGLKNPWVFSGLSFYENVEKAWIRLSTKIWSSVVELASVCIFSHPDICPNSFIQIQNQFYLQWRLFLLEIIVKDFVCGHNQECLPVVDIAWEADHTTLTQTAKAVRKKHTSTTVEPSTSPLCLLSQCIRISRGPERKSGTRSQRWKGWPYAGQLKIITGCFIDNSEPFVGWYTNKFFRWVLIFL